MEAEVIGMEGAKETKKNIGIEKLPLEILMHICQYLDARYVIRVLSKVSKAFNDILTVDSYWKARITKRWPKLYPPIPDDSDRLDWREACVEREHQYSQWYNSEQRTLTFSYDCDLFSTVDCVHLMKRGEMLIAGSRDRNLNVIDVTKLTQDTVNETKTARIHVEPNAHKGWIWCVASSGDNIYSGSWDKDIKHWDLSGGCVLANSYRCKSAVLDVHTQCGLIFAATYAKVIYVIDPRTDSAIEHKWHSKPVLSLAVTEDVIISCSEDSTVKFYDRRKAAVSDTLELPGTYGMCMSLSNHALWVGDKSGQVHLIDTRPASRSIVKTYDVKHEEKITGIQHTLGALYTCSTDGLLRIHEPNQEPDCFCSIKTSGQLSGLSYQNDVLATAGPNISINIIKGKRQREL